MDKHAIQFQQNIITLTDNFQIRRIHVINTNYYKNLLYREKDTQTCIKYKLNTIRLIYDIYIYIEMHQKSLQGDYYNK